MYTSVRLIFHLIHNYKFTCFMIIVLPTNRYIRATPSLKIAITSPFTPHRPINILAKAFSST